MKNLMAKPMTSQGYTADTTPFRENATIALSFTPNTRQILHPKRWIDQRAG
jgi:hypothetical protein